MSEQMNKLRKLFKIVSKLLNYLKLNGIILGLKRFISTHLINISSFKAVKKTFVQQFCQGRTTSNMALLLWVDKVITVNMIMHYLHNIIICIIWLYSLT